MWLWSSIKNTNNAFVCLNQDGRLCCSYVIRCGDAGHTVGYDGVVAGSANLPQLPNHTDILPSDATSVATIPTISSDSNNNYQKTSSTPVAVSSSQQQQPQSKFPHMEDDSPELHNQVLATASVDTIIPSSKPFVNQSKNKNSRLVTTNTTKQQPLSTSTFDSANVGSSNQTSTTSSTSPAEQNKATRVVNFSAVSAEKIMFVSDGTEQNISNKTYSGDAG